jgi:hypothetical protein
MGEWLVLIVSCAAAGVTVMWLVRRFLTENRRIDEMIRDFNRQNPRHEPALPPRSSRVDGLRRRR